MYKINITELHNESDVEQKVLFPLITKDEPEGLGYQSIHIQTKSNLKKIEIEKGDKAKLYFPDYILLPHGIPSVIIEAKKPGEDLNEAFREARLYATEVNALYKKNINPCSFVIASDGTKLLAGSWDDSNPKYEIDVDDWLSTDRNFSGFLKEFSLQNTKKFAESIRDKIRTKVRYKKPIHGLGGKHIQNRQINNSFGETLSLNHRHLFNPTEEAERVDIVNNAYIKIPKHLAHVNPIDKLIRKKVRPSIQYSKILSDDENNKEIIQKLSDASKLNNEVMLLIGSVGSGKSTFTTYLKEIALNDNIKNKLLWVRIDLNNSPVAREELYKWIKKDIINSLKNTDKEFDPDTINGLKELYEIKIDTFNKVALELFPEETPQYKEKLFQEITRLKADIDLTLDACEGFP